MRATVDWRITLRLAAGSVPAPLLTVLLLGRMGAPGAATAQLISVMLGVALVLTALSLFGRKRIPAYTTRHLAEPSSWRTLLLTVATGAILGGLVSLTSVGAGAIGATALLMLCPRLPIARDVGSDIAHVVPLTLLAGIGHWLTGSVSGPLLGSLLAGSVPGIALGGLVAASVPELVLRPALATTLLIVGSGMVA
jgi:hypothetical protein